MPDDAAAAETSDSVRLFFALWPGAAMQAALADAVADAVRESEGRTVPADNLHLTLVFLGSVPRTRLPVLDEIASRCASHFKSAQDGLVLTLDTVEHWRRPHILCATSTDAPPGVATRAKALKRALTAEGFSLDLKTPFRPHVTVARKVTHPLEPKALGPVTWHFNEFVLVQSLSSSAGSTYTPLTRYRLG
jgi:2'-5' RNA ligase